MQINLVNLSDGDWEALYIDDELVLEGHSLTAREVLEYLSAELQNRKSIPTIQFSSEEYSSEKLENEFNSIMPDSYKELLEKRQILGSVPENLYYAVQKLKDELDKETLGYIKQNGYLGLHHGLGTAIRNKWGLWQNSVLAEWFKNALGIEHADDMSGIILESLYRELNDRDWEPEKQAQKYKDYWNNLGKENII